MEDTQASMGVAGTDPHVLSFWDRHATLPEHRCLNQPASSLSLLVSVFLLKFYYMGTIEEIILQVTELNLQPLSQESRG